MRPITSRLRLLLVAAALIATAGFIARYRHATRPRGFQRLRIAIAQGNQKEVLALLDSGLDVKAPLYMSLLVTAIRFSDDNMVELLLKRGAEPNQNSMGGTPLGAAAAYNRPTTIALLLAAGARPELSGEGGVPLERAVENCSMDAARLLVARGAPKLPALPNHLRSEACRRCPVILQVAAFDPTCP